VTIKERGVVEMDMNRAPIENFLEILLAIAEEEDESEVKENGKTN
jgi:hypothetical protein